MNVFTQSSRVDSSKLLVILATLWQQHASIAYASFWKIPIRTVSRYYETPIENNAHAVNHIVKYVGLLAMSRLRSTHPKLIAENKDIILECIDDHDFSIRLRALDLVVGMVSDSLLPSLGSE